MAHQKLAWVVALGAVGLVAAVIVAAAISTPQAAEPAPGDTESYSLDLGSGSSDGAVAVAARASTQPSKKETPTMVFVKVRVFDAKGELVGPVDSPKLELSDRDWQQRLTSEQYHVLRSKGTERPFCGTLLDNKMHGVYTCVGCGLPLFSSDSKFNSGTGWPSFFQPISKENVVEHSDHSHGMTRSEILCARCDGHLGHVFDDGPRPTGLRFCLNSESLEFTPSDALAKLADPAAESRPVGR